MRSVALGALVLFAALGSVCREPQVLIRPSCRFRVVDEATGLPIPDVKISVFTLYDTRDTVGRWELATDEWGLAGMHSILTPKRVEDAKGRKTDLYSYIAALQAEGYQYYSLRINRQSITVRLARGFPVACS